MTLYAILVSIVLLGTTLLPRKWRTFAGVSASILTAGVIEFL